ncbi:hypothetical protein C8F01DRAFT_1155129 [Mycena amicta]|nr:hypothetical protein C8F01DRAFT_1155129 [Mycena amicta]
MSTDVAPSSAPAPPAKATPPPQNVTPPLGASSLKRKTPPTPGVQADQDDDRKPLILQPGSALPAGLSSGHGEYAAGRVLCAACGIAVSFRDQATATFTVRHWEAHRLSCPRAGTTPPNGESHAFSYPPPPPGSSGPPLKRRRAKRTEDERIAYLRADAHVAQFEAYRVLCASCDKWIRLRPNSTYCSIPWDAHRKSCLAKKAGALSAPTNAPRPPPTSYPSAFDEITRDPDVRRVEPDRMMCGICEKWLSLPPDDPAAAVQVWHAHRNGCQKTASALRNVASPPTENHSVSSPQPSGPNQPVRLPLPDAPHVVLDLSPANYAAPHESRRRNAEQRAATLRADVLIRAGRAKQSLCSLCTKWVQLRQDSSYCAYPWLQHRGKCLARYQRRAQKAADISGPKGTGRRPASAHVSSGAIPGGGNARGDDEPESEEGGPGLTMSMGGRRAPPPAHPPRAIPAGYAAAASWAPSKSDAQAVNGHAQHGNADADGEGDDVDADGDSYMEDDSPPSRPNGVLRRAVPANLADLDSPAGRRNFIWASVEYLFRTTHEASDDLSVGALLTYVNAAMPTDKHEDFDMVEVVHAASALTCSRDREHARYKLEGDMIRVQGE